MSTYLRMQLLVALVTSFSFSLIGQSNTTNTSTVSIAIPNLAELAVKTTNTGTTIKRRAANEVIHQLDATTLNATNSLWLNYSSIVGEAIKLNGRKITAQIEGELPPNMTIKVQATQDAGKGGGKVGQPNTGPILLSTLPQAIVNDIGTCYTGAPENNGHRLIYTIDKDNNTNLDEYSSILITYKLTD